VIDAVYRAESRCVLATLIRRLGGFELAEEALHEAFAAAVEQWPREGMRPMRAPHQIGLRPVATARRRRRLVARLGACVRDHRASAGGAPARPPYVLATRNGRRARPGRARDWPRPPPCLSQALRAPVTRARATYRFLGKVWVNERG